MRVWDLFIDINFCKLSSDFHMCSCTHTNDQPAMFMVVEHVLYPALKFFFHTLNHIIFSIKFIHVCMRNNMLQALKEMYFCEHTMFICNPYLLKGTVYLPGSSVNNSA